MLDAGVISPPIFSRIIIHREFPTLLWLVCFSSGEYKMLPLSEVIKSFFHELGIIDFPLQIKRLGERAPINFEKLNQDPIVQMQWHYTIIKSESKISEGNQKFLLTFWIEKNLTSAKLVNAMD